MNNKGLDGIKNAKNILLDVPVIKIVGNKEIIIENHRGIILLEDTVVKLKSNIGNIVIMGKDFNLLFMDGPTIAIGGSFKSFEYEGGGK